MKIKILILVVASLLLPASLHAKVNIFACEPHWKSLAEEIGKEKINAYSAINHQQDPHFIRAKPSLIAKIRKADMVICSGADLEVGWLPILLQKAKKSVQNAEIGNLMLSRYVETLEKPKIIDRSLGDIHPQGNPHIHLNPRNILIAAKLVNDRLQEIDSPNAQFYQDNYDKFKQDFSSAIVKWELQARSLRNMKIVTHHKTFSYLVDWLKLKHVGNLEAKSGISPSSTDLLKLLETLKNQPAKIIIRSSYDPRGASNWLMKRTNIKELEISSTIDNKNANNLFEFYEYIINSMIDNND